MRIIEHPINLRQAFWAPYKQAGRLIGEQLSKVAAARSKATEEKMAVPVVQTATKADSGKPAEEKAFDVGKFAGIFAAVGLAIGAIGTALASIITGLLRLAWWQLAPGGPRIYPDYLGTVHLHRLVQASAAQPRPILDANGWAVNTRAKININLRPGPDGRGKTPEGAEKPLRDPFADKQSPWGLYASAAILIIACLLIWKFVYLDRWLAPVKGTKRRTGPEGNLIGP